MEDKPMSATATATNNRIVKVEGNIDALHEPENGGLEFRLWNAKGDWILGTSSWQADRHMTDEEIGRYYSDRRDSIECDFSSALSMR
jgi:hypothetical protein